MLEHPADLDPQLVADQVYSTRRRRFIIGVPAMMALLLMLLYMLPATLIVPNLTYAGRPALLLAMGMWAWWLLARLNPRLILVGPQPLRWVALAYVVSNLMSYLAGVLRGLPAVESNAMNFSLLIVCEFLGLLLMAADGIPNLARLNGVLRVLVWCAAFMAIVGIIQTAFQMNITQYLVLPGLELKADLIGFEDRGDGNLFRVAGTATHYIEFSTVLAMAVPFAIHFARFAPLKRTRTLATAACLVIAMAVPLAISRTGILALGAAILVMSVLAWNWRMRYHVLVITIVGIGAMAAVKPGLVGTIRSLFLSAMSDPSVQGRTEDYAYVERFIADRPWLGRGPGTFIPTIYDFIDNQWLISLLTTGIVGVAALAALHITCIVLAGLAMRRTDSPELRHLCAALISAQVIAILVAATFDSMSFTTYAFTLALLSGACGAMWRFTHPARTVRTSAVRAHPVDRNS